MAPIRPAPATHASNAGVTGPPELRRHLFKTKLCRFAGMGKCRHGSDCPFAHNPAELEEQPDLTKTSMCKDWLKGTCNRSHLDCPFAHGNEELRAAPFKKPGFVQPRLDSKALSNCLQTELETSGLREAQKPGRVHRNRKQLALPGGQHRASAGDEGAMVSYQSAHGDGMGKPIDGLQPVVNKSRFRAPGHALLDTYSMGFLPEEFAEELGSPHPCVGDADQQGMVMLPMLMSPVGSEEAWFTTSSPWTPTNVDGDNLEAMLRMAMPDHYED